MSCSNSWNMFAGTVATQWPVRLMGLVGSTDRPEAFRTIRAQIPMDPTQRCHVSRTNGGLV